MATATLAGPGLMEQTNAGRSESRIDADDRSLIDRVASGRDVAAFETLYESYRRRLGPFMFRIVRDTAANEEAFNDVMLTVWQKASAYNGESRVSTWIFGIAYRTCLKCLRSKRRDANTTPVVEDLPADEGNADERDLVAHALTRLTDEHRMVIELSYFLGHTYQEIAAIADCPENTVKTRVFHARRRLKQIMNDLGERPARGTQDE